MNEFDGVILLIFLIFAVPLFIKLGISIYLEHRKNNKKAR